MDFFCPEEEAADKTNTSEPWNVLIVDDDPEIHAVTKLALNDFELGGKKLNLISVYSGAEAINFLQSIDDTSIAIILLDVVMETHTAGLDLANFIRKKLNNHCSRIILRTGQPADIPEQRIVVEYDINDYKNKTELTLSRLFVTMVTSLRSYDELISHEHKEVELADSKKQLEISTKAKDVFIARMSHELLTPLNAIMGFSQIQQLNFQADPVIIDAELTEEVLKASRHLQMLIEDTLEFVESDDFKRALVLESCDINQVITESISLLRNSAEQRNITIRNHSTNLKVFANNDRLKQCIVNLISNAIKFNLVNGKIDIRVEQVNEQKIEISVADTGVGIALDDHELIFEKFARLPYAETQEIRGAGIGLTLTQRLVEKMNGEIGLKSQLGKGSVFWLRFSVGN